MNKKKIGIVAKKLNHSLSPFIHNHWAKKNNNKFIYRKYEVQEKKIDKFFDNYRKTFLCSFLVPRIFYK